MTTAKIERCGDVQRVQLPAGFQFDADEVEILRRGDEVVLRRPRPNLREAFDLLAGMPEDFFAGPREDPPPQQREPL